MLHKHMQHLLFRVEVAPPPPFVHIGIFFSPSLLIPSSTTAISYAVEMLRSKMYYSKYY